MKQELGRAAIAALAVSSLTACAVPGADHKYPTVDDAAEAYQATVYITVVQEDGGQSGTGWFVADGLVVTAGHVCKPGLLTVRTFDGAEYDAHIGHISKTADVCIMTTEAKAPAVLRLGPDASTLKFGELAWFVGYPQGLLSLGEGRISGMHDGGEYLVATVPAWFGASGSALLNGRGDVVGVLSALGVNNGSVILFAPVDEVKIALRVYAAQPLVN